LERFNEWRFKAYVIEKDFEGINIKFYIADLCAKEWYDDNRKTTPETEFINEHLIKSGSIVADCGAHHGLVTILSAKEIGSEGRVFSFEPSPRNAAAIRNNIEINNLNNVSVENIAVGASNSTIGYIDSSNGYVTSDISDPLAINVEMISLDNFFEGKRVPTFIKIDVEGYELDVLKGAQSILQQRPSLAIEFHTSTYKDPVGAFHEFNQLLKVTQYNMYVQTKIDGQISEYNINRDTPSFLSKYDNVHFFGIPINS